MMTADAHQAPEHGGTTGDTAGALLELLEVLVLVGLALVAD